MPYAAGTGNDHEDERNVLIRDWLFGVIKWHTELAKANGFGDEWETFTKEQKLPYDFADKVDPKYADLNEPEYYTLLSMKNVVTDFENMKYGRYILYRMLDIPSMMMYEEYVIYWHCANPIKLLKELIEVSNTTKEI